MIVELRTLIAIARHGTFAEAGNRIGLTQAAVSGHVRRLEQTLGFALFERTGRSATLNAAGLRTLARAEDIVSRFDALGEAGDDAEAAGVLKVGAIASAQATMIARALVPFRARFPLYGVHVMPGLSLHLMDQVDVGELDLAVLVQPSFTPPADLEWQTLVREDYVLLAPDAIAGDDWKAILQHHPFIQYDRSSFGGRQVERLFREAGLKPHHWLEIDDIQAIASMVGKGLGVAVAPAAEILSRLPKGVRAIPFKTDLVRREIGILFRKSSASEVATAFIEYLVDHASLPSLPYDGEGDGAVVDQRESGKPV